jgi:hypothetical protein
MQEADQRRCFIFFKNYIFDTLVFFTIMKYPTIFFLLLSLECFSQNQNSIWCFGDSAGIDYSGVIPLTFVSGMDGRGSCVSISDSSGSLLFYAETRAGMIWNSARTYNKLHQLMQNDDSIYGEAWYNELVIVPVGNNIYYLFSTCVSFANAKGLYYCVIDMNQNGGLGAVIQKNIQLNNFQNADCLSAVKHGNGRDWWVLSKQYNPSGTSHNRFYVYLVTSSGISDTLIQNLGNAIDYGFQKIIFNSTGEKLMHLINDGFLAEYDFDRCTGTISNQNIIYLGQTGNITRYFWEGAYSPDNSKFYISITVNEPSVNDTSYILQYDLASSNIHASRDTLFYIKMPVVGGAIRLAPDGKIYYTCLYASGVPNGYPYPDSTRNMYNENLGVINYPDSAGPACNFQPFSFYLGGKRTYWGLPNNPNYSLGPLAGSPCDTLGVGINEPILKIYPELFVFYHPGWQKLFVNAQHIKGRNCLLQINDMNGRKVFSLTKQTQPPYFTQEIDCSTLSSGVYVVSLQTEKEQLVKKFVKE